ncbi:MAG: threonine/serine exporter family protein [Paramuribaculum sp.]|nr:threonine/serine exporter family protein [Paramuribaculum sp.]
MIIVDILLDGLFAAVASIGFGAISNVPVRSFTGCAIPAAVGHMSRYMLMNLLSCNIILASFCGAFAAGMIAVWLSKYYKCPAETLSIPAMLPMIPGMYAYHAVQALVLTFTQPPGDSFNHYFTLFNYNAGVCTLVMLGLVGGVLFPIFIFNRRAFTATRIIDD